MMVYHASAVEYYGLMVVAVGAFLYMAFKR